ncbi:putative signal peptidase complex subunit 2 [Glycine soja]|uniref:Signal peptidase complex subunit 2 n=1 Tax=Glycine soja TaxID=3848 RepID=A0A445LU42_GLYSO|nr:putative signal peptidase complex subunit 2 [Glycine soja]
MPKPPKSIFHHLLYNRRYSNPLSNSFVSNFILSSLTTHPPQHPHLRYTDFILMLALDRPTFCSGSFTSTGLVVSSKLPRFSDMYTLTIASADPKSISANDQVHFTKSVTQWFTKDGVLVEGLFWKDVEALIVQYTKEPKKSK